MSDTDGLPAIVEDAIYSTTVSRSAVDFEWPECHKARCKVRHGDVDEAFRIVLNRVAENVRTALLLAGHEAASRPRQVASVTELDALPVGSVVLSEQGAVFERLNEAHWSETGFMWKPQSEDITTPARVLYVPED